MEVDDGNSGEPRLRVCVLAAHFVNQSGMWLGGGAEKYLLSIIGGLLEWGVDVRVGYCGDDLYGDLREQWGRERLSCERLDWLDARLSGDRRISGALVRERREWFERQKVESVFFVQQAHGAAFGAAVIGARLAGARVVMSVRQPPAPFPQSAGKRYLGLVPSLEVWRRQLRWRSQRVARNCHGIIFNCDAGRRSFIEQWGWPSSRCCVIPNGADRRPPQRARANGVITFGCVGQVAEHKGADVVVEAARRMAEAGETFEVAFFGDGALVGPLKSASSGLPIRFHSFVRDAEQIYAQIDVLVAASRRESSSNSVLEAMARAIPCIVSDVGGLPELVHSGAAGLMVPAGDAGALVEAMRRLCRDAELRASIGLAGQRVARADHIADSRLRETIELILGKGGVRRLTSNAARETVSV